MTSTSHAEFYAHAARYDALFNWRDLDADARFLTGLFDTWRSTVPLRSVLELAAGPAAHARWFARHGMRTHALDCAQEMLDYAASLEPNLRTHLEDMSDFTWEDEPVDLAICLIDSLSYILDHDSFMRHVECVAQAMSPGALYVLEVVHPQGPLGGEDTTHTTWSVEHEGDTLEISFGIADDPFDPITQIRHTTTHLKVTRAGELVSDIKDVAPLKLWLVQELLGLLRHSPFMCVALHGALRSEVSIHTSEGSAHHAVLVLQRR
jgi:ubiquinone/menaquinone biosynthesis C-methylase UbiE